MPSAPNYLCPDYITYKELVINQPPPTNNGRFDHKNRPMQKRKYEVIKQVYRVKRDGRLNKNLDLTLAKEKPVVEEILASFVDPFAPNRDHTSKNIAEQNPSSAGGKIISKRLVLMEPV